jgi:hypothetical protein
MTYQLGSSPNEQAKGIAEWRVWWQTACVKDKQRQAGSLAVDSIIKLHRL